MMQSLNGSRSDNVRRPHSVGPRLGTSPFHDLNDPQFGVQANAVGTPVESPSGPRPNLRGSASDRRGTASVLLARNAARRHKSSNLRGTLFRDDHAPEAAQSSEGTPGAQGPEEAPESEVNIELLDFIVNTDHANKLYELMLRVQTIENKLAIGFDDDMDERTQSKHKARRYGMDELSTPELHSIATPQRSPSAMPGAPASGMVAEPKVLSKDDSADPALSRRRSPSTPSSMPMSLLALWCLM